MGHVNAAGKVAVQDSGELLSDKTLAKMEAREAGFIKKAKDNGLNHTYSTETLSVDAFVDNNQNHKYDRGEETGVEKQATIYKFSKFDLEDPKFVKFLDKSGYVEVPGRGYIFGGKTKEAQQSAVAEFQTHFPLDEPKKEMEGDVYAKAPAKAPPAPQPTGTNIYGNPADKHRKGAPVAKNDEAPKQNDSKRKVGSDQPVTSPNGDEVKGEETIKVGGYSTKTNFEPKWRPITAREFGEIAPFEKNIPDNDAGIEKARVYRPRQDSFINAAFSDKQVEERKQQVFRFAQAHGYQIVHFDVRGEEAYLFVK